MEVKELLRVVGLSKGKLKPSEFRLREGEVGLSLFARTAHPSPDEVREAVRAAGKRGELAVAVLSVEQIGSLGLVLVQTPGGTPSPEVNAIHYEACLRWFRRLLLRLRGIGIHDYFNQELSPKLCEAARVLD
ncbi:MAG TPA: hypothetical protein VNK04_09935 [Gemmataceae bacterium]|jgi:hypothetical protein|nr:hypothetical protein [Gemmataceae bacterium]